MWKRCVHCMKTYMSDEQGLSGVSLNVTSPTVSAESLSLPINQWSSTRHCMSKCVSLQQTGGCGIMRMAAALSPCILMFAVILCTQLERNRCQQVCHYARQDYDNVRCLLLWNVFLSSIEKSQVDILFINIIAQGTYSISEEIQKLRKQ